MPVHRGACRLDSCGAPTAKGLLANGSPKAHSWPTGAAAASIRFKAGLIAAPGLAAEGSGLKAAAVSNTRTTSVMRGLQTRTIS